MVRIVLKPPEEENIEMRAAIADMFAYKPVRLRNKKKKAAAKKRAAGHAMFNKENDQFNRGTS
jgi:hypothetical protein